MIPTAKHQRGLLFALAPIGLMLAFMGSQACSDGESQPEPGPSPSAASASELSTDSDETRASNTKRGRWARVQSNRDAQDLTDEQREEIEGLEGLGYADGLHDAPELIGVTRHNKDKTSGGINLFTSAHAATAQLIDMQGEVLHEWNYPFRKVWPKYPKQDQLSTFWRRNYLYENGDLLAIYEGLGIIKIDKNSTLLWANGIRAHHDMEVLADGSIYILSREARMVPRVNEKKPVLEDFIAILDSEGQVTQRISLLEAMEASEYSDLWNKSTNWDGDLFHTNSLEVLDGRLADVNPAFSKGNILVSMLLLDLVAVVDPEREEIVWASAGPYHYQHDPHVLENGHVMIFDNQGAGIGKSRVLELDLATWKPVWSYRGSEKQPFYSETCGLAQRLADGNTLITESDLGRAFEISPDGGIVWEFHNPNRGGANKQFIATMMEMYRLPAGFPLDWLDD